MDSDSDDGRILPGLAGENSSDDEGFIPAQEAVRIGTSVDFTFDLPSGQRTIRIGEDSSGGCGGKTWEAATVICNHIIHCQKTSPPSNPFLTRNTKLIELGAGTGVAAILAAILTSSSPLPTILPPPSHLSPHPITMTDMLFLDLMRENVKNNLTPSEQSLILVEELTWGKPLKETITPPYDIILAADCVYLEAAFDPLIETLLQLSSPETQIIITSKKRRKADKRFFVKLRKVFDVVEVKDDPHYEEYNKQSITILYARKKVAAS